MTRRKKNHWQENSELYYYPCYPCSQTLTRTQEEQENNLYLKLKSDENFCFGNGYFLGKRIIICN